MQRNNGATALSNLTCPICSIEVANDNDLRNHMASDHPHARPMLRIGDHTQHTITIQRPIAPGDITLTNCTRVEATKDGTRIELEDADTFREAMSHSGDAIWHVVLWNHNHYTGGSSQSDYEINIRIPNDEELDHIDDAFQSLCDIEDIAMHDITDFAKSLNGLRSAALQYGKGLSCYVQGTLTKEAAFDKRYDHPIISSRDLMRRSRDLLAPFSRRHAGIARGLVDFNLNDFTHGSYTHTLLDVSHCVFYSLTRSHADVSFSRTHTKDGYRQRPVFRTDSVTVRLLQWCHYIALSDVDSIRAAIAHGEESIQRLPLTSEDRIKYDVLRSLSLIKVGDKADAEASLRDLCERDDSWARKWALSQLRRLEGGS